MLNGELYKAIIQVKKYRLLRASLGVLTSKPTNTHEDNELVVHAFQYHRVAPYLKFIDIPIYYLRHEHGYGLFETHSATSGIKFSNMDTKPESVPHLMRSSSIGM